MQIHQPTLLRGDCLRILRAQSTVYDLSFLDPPFNQGKEYRHFNDQQDSAVYWRWMGEVLAEVFRLTSDGGSVYFMQREKNAAFVLNALHRTGWTLQNLIIWKKMASAAPCSQKYGKHYQIIAYATKGVRPRVFNRLRIQPPSPPHHKHPRARGLYVTDVWDDIRELTSGYFAGDEPLRDKDNARFHKQQAPIALLLRILLASSMPGDRVLDPFAGTGTTIIVAQQLGRASTAIELDPINMRRIKKRMARRRDADRLDRFYAYYGFTQHLDQIWEYREITKVRQEASPKHSKDVLHVSSLACSSS